MATTSPRTRRASTALSALIGILLLSTTTSSAQEGYPRIVPGPLSTAHLVAVPFGSAPEPRQDSLKRVIPPTYWAEGALIGGAAGGFLSGVVVMAFCDFDESGDAHNCIAAGNAGMLVGAVLAGIPSSLIGGLFRKPDRAPGDVLRGNKSTLGALAFGLPSLVITAAGVDEYCNQRPDFVFTHGRCGVGNMLTAFLVGVVNTGVGYLLGRSIKKWGPPKAP